MNASAPASPSPASPASTLHLLGRFSQAYTGAERELLDIRRLLQGRRPVKLWSDVPLHPSYAGQDIAVIQPFAQQFPRGGALLIAGVHMRPGLWLKYAKFEQIILFYNLANHAQLFAAMESLRDSTGLDPELVFVSKLLQLSVGLPGRISRSLMDVQPFLAVAGERFAQASTPGAADRPFTVGRVSRDAPDKHHPEDPALYRMLASRGLRVRIMGGTCMAQALAGVEGVELLPAGAESTPDFYRSLDAFFYRTGASTEAYGRVVVEAMAAGLPVVAHVRGGYAEVMEDGVSGRLIQSQEEAYDAVMQLAADPALCRSMGEAGRLQAIAVHGPEATQREMVYYLGPAAAWCGR
ncbi:MULTISPECIES: glycosyltransferase [unclassified Polaromonas]|uniref:glycosyltransferase n=1 Tax=unclassified Polaromonas TaxID=2638319 RepID=UPI000F07EC4D|nr:MULTISPECIES: glycosyltransferase [unclassified Polaromonas]AYQ30609.1 glycosyltransferase [Polaromonas sp. SP1]QGJ19111.1 glycosyltransferase [Polaromonas sp. Pch-P]